MTSSPEHRRGGYEAVPKQPLERKSDANWRKWFNVNKGIGPDVFVHISSVERSGLPTLVEGQKLGYEVSVDTRSGKTSADMLKLQR